MKTLLARILCSAAHSMWKNDPTLGQYTSETNQHELNLAFHYASELRRWFPWLDCDFDVSKQSCNQKRPDIVLHRRRTHAFNFLVIEIKREQNRHNVPLDLKRIRESWFENYFRYRFGAAVILEDDKPEFEVQVLSRVGKDSDPQILPYSDMGAMLSAPNLEHDRHGRLSETVDCIVAAKLRDPEANTSALEREIDELVYALYGLRPEEIELVEQSKRR